MKPRLRQIVWITTALSMALPVLFLAGCSGGSSGGGSSTVNVSMASTEPNVVSNSVGTFPAGSMTVEPLAATPAADNINHVWITVHRVSLIPGGNAPGPDPNGEMAVQDTTPPDASGHISADLDPVEVDLLNLPTGGLARFLDAITDVPPGTYGKIRLNYTNPTVHFIGAPENTTIQGTANYHIDIHFAGGKLVIPPESTVKGVQLHDVVIQLVLGKEGLKITVGPTNILMRPQVFATDSVVRYILSGKVDNVNKSSSTFDLDAGQIFHAAYNNVSTHWSFRESEDPFRSVPIDNNAFAIAAFDNEAKVSTIGTFSTGGLFLADDVTITFPVNKVGTVDSGDISNGWMVNDTFSLALPDNNLVNPKPSRVSARYDNTSLSPLINRDAAIVKGAVVTARGYAIAGGGGTEAFWISVGP